MVPEGRSANTATAGFVGEGNCFFVFGKELCVEFLLYGRVGAVGRLAQVDGVEVTRDVQIVLLLVRHLVDLLEQRVLFETLMLV